MTNWLKIVREQVQKSDLSSLKSQTTSKTNALFGSDMKKIQGSCIKCLKDSHAKGFLKHKNFKTLNKEDNYFLKY